jgi:hypothetical protein
MDDKVKPENMKQIHVSTSDEMSRGRYSNSMMVTHGSDEFILDWFLNSTTGMHLVSRIIVSPAHVKRIINALKENLDNYEKQLMSVRETNVGSQKIQ